MVNVVVGRYTGPLRLWQQRVDERRRQPIAGLGAPALFSKAGQRAGCPWLRLVRLVVEMMDQNARLIGCTAGCAAVPEPRIEALNQ